MVYLSKSQNAIPVWLSDPETGDPYRSGNNSQTYQLANNQSVAATSGTTPVTDVQDGSYLWDVQFTGTSVVLQSLGSDGVTWRDVETQTASGTAGVVIGKGATVRLYNPNGSAITGVYSSLT